MKYRNIALFKIMANALALRAYRIQIDHDCKFQSPL